MFHHLVAVKRDFKSMANRINLKIDTTDDVVMKTNLTNPRGRIEHYVGKKYMEYAAVHPCCI